MLERNQHFDIRLLMFQALAYTPSQVLQLSLCDDLKDMGDQRYIVTAITNLGLNLLAYRVGKDIFSWTYGIEPASPNTTYMVSPATEYLIDYTKTNITNLHPQERPGMKTDAQDMLSDAPKYSATYVNTNVAAYSASAILGIITAHKNLKMSPIKSLLYGLTQPTSVILKDSSVGYDKRTHRGQ